MKRSFWQHTLATLALVLALPAAVFAQANPAVLNENNVVVADGADAEGYLMTEFPGTLLNDSSEAFFKIVNQGDADLEVGFITGSAQFKVVSQPAGAPNTSATVAAGGQALFSIAFEPTLAGPDDEVLVIPTNAPGAESSYTFEVAGVGYVTLPPAPNIGVEFAEKKGITAPLKVKLNKKTSQFKVSGSVVVANTGPVEVASADIEVWYSADDTLDESVDTFLGFNKKPLTKIKAFDPIKNKTKVKKAKVAVEVPTATGFIFVKTFLISPNDTEVTYLDNVTHLELP